MNTNIDFLRTAILGGDFSDDVCAKLLEVLSEVEKLRDDLMCQRITYQEAIERIGQERDAYRQRCEELIAEI